MISVIDLYEKASKLGDKLDEERLVAKKIYPHGNEIIETLLEMMRDKSMPKLRVQAAKILLDKICPNVAQVKATIETRTVQRIGILGGDSRSNEILRDFSNQEIKEIEQTATGNSGGNRSEQNSINSSSIS